MSYTDRLDLRVTTTMELEITEQSLGDEALEESLPDISAYLVNNGALLEKFSILNPDGISYATFHRDYLLANRPCLFSHILTSDWDAVRDWTTADPADDGKRTINHDFLIKRYGTCNVSVTNCDDLEQNYDNPSCTVMTVEEYLKYFEHYRNNLSPPMPCLYLKDWHIIPKNSTIEGAPYKVPKFFASDWLNETADEQGDDFRFAYIGPRGSWTPFHSDVYGSFSWSTNVIGVKKWLLYPPGKEERFRTKSNRIRFDQKNPGVPEVDFYEVIQGPGQVVFVPSGWHHIVWNLEDTISINHNWINAANVGYIWANLKRALGDVQNELNDLKDAVDFPDLCQGLLKANHGMNFTSFVQILSTVAANRKEGVSYLPQYSLGPNHVNLDLSVLRGLRRSMKSDPAVRHFRDSSFSFREALDAFGSKVT